jgi:hypothetical protein
MIGYRKQTERPVFIISTGRSGSKMLASALAKIPAVCALHEPLPHMNVEAFAHWSDSHTDEVVMARVRQKRRGLIEQVQQNGFVYVESSHYCTHLVSYLHQLFDARFIYLYRNGRNFVRSGLERGWYDRQPISARLKTIIRRRLLINVGNSYLDHRLRPPKELKTSFEKITWLWVEINRIALRELSTIQDQDKYLLPLEMFGQEKAAEICHFLGLQPDASLLKAIMDVSRKKPNQTVERSILPPTEWEAAKQQRFAELASEMMIQLGYWS